MTHRRTLVVVGNGMVGHRFCERLPTRATRSTASHRLRRRGAAARVRSRPPERVLRGTIRRRPRAGRRAWYAERGITLHLGERVVALDRGPHGRVVTSAGRRIAYDAARARDGLGTLRAVHPRYRPAGRLRLPDDRGPRGDPARGLDRARAAVIGGGLLGLEAAKAMLDLGCDARRRVRAAAHAAPGRRRRRRDCSAGRSRQLGVAGPRRCPDRGARRRRRRDRASPRRRPEIPVDMVIVSAGIRPRDELARAVGLAVGRARWNRRRRRASGRRSAAVHCIGEIALHREHDLRPGRARLCDGRGRPRAAVSVGGIDFPGATCRPG